MRTKQKIKLKFDKNQKYYVPFENEFRKGFVFELKYNKEEWKEEIFDEDDKSYSSLSHLKYSLCKGEYDKLVRVKFLDFKDFESLKFKQKSVPINSEVIVFTRKIFSKDILIVSHNPSTKFTTITIKSTRTTYPVRLFVGFLKNKTELKELLDTYMSIGQSYLYKAVGITKFIVDEKVNGL